MAGRGELVLGWLGIETFRGTSELTSSKLLLIDDKMPGSGSLQLKRRGHGITYPRRGLGLKPLIQRTCQGWISSSASFLPPAVLLYPLINGYVSYYHDHVHGL